MNWKKFAERLLLTCISILCDILKSIADILIKKCMLSK